MCCKNIPYYCSYCIAIQVVGFGDPLGLVLGSMGYFHSNRCWRRFWVLNLGFRFGYVEISPDLNLPIAIPSSGYVNDLEKVMEPL